MFIYKTYSLWCHLSSNTVYSTILRIDCQNNVQLSIDYITVNGKQLSWYLYTESCTWYALIKHCYTLISGFHHAFFKVSHFYWPTNALNCIKLKC